MKFKVHKHKFAVLRALIESGITSKTKAKGHKAKASKLFDELESKYGVARTTIYVWASNCRLAGITLEELDAMNGCNNAFIARTSKIAGGGATWVQRDAQKALENKPWCEFAHRPIVPTGANA